jgi:hypothetical protein
MAGKPIESNEPPRSGYTLVFFWERCLFSLVVFSFCIAVTMEVLFTNRTTIWEGIPPIVAVIVFFILMCIVGMLEDMQIAFFAEAKLPASECGTNLFAMKTCDLLFSGEGNNLPGIMIGR